MTDGDYLQLKNHIIGVEYGKQLVALILILIYKMDMENEFMLNSFNVLAIEVLAKLVI